MGTLAMVRHEGRPRQTLTARERSVLMLMAQGYSNDGIARQLVLSHRTVEAYVSRLFEKLDIAACDDHNRRVLAVLAFLREGRAVAGGHPVAPTG